MQKLDKIDLKLLSLLEEDARQPVSQIAKQLKTSQQVVSYRLKSLEKRGVLGGYLTIINIALLGYTSYRTMIRLANASKERYQAMISSLMQHPNVLWLVECGGRWDLLINFSAQNIVHYDQMLRELTEAFGDVIHDYDVLTTVEVRYLGREYFTKSQHSLKPSPYIRRELHTLPVDTTATKILSLLSEHGRASAVEIAQKLKISPNTVLLRIKYLKKQGVIQGFKPLIHLEKTPYSGYKLLMKFHLLTSKKETELISVLHTFVHVVGIIRLVGSWDFEVEFEVASKEEMLTLVRSIRDHCKDTLRESEVLPLYHEYRYNFFPRDLIPSPRRSA
ncbi:Lrp/AsnC family transcriptional regulator [Candidatus Woesearchaeota archaeon]|nr:Lrp/AsnC family transcriptional regulator [Candidatus Woesearchaeota archaeon]